MIFQRYTDLLDLKQKKKSHNSTTYLNENNNIYILYLYELGFLLFNPTIKPNNEHATTQNTIPTAIKRYEFFCSKQNGKMKDERKCQ